MSGQELIQLACATFPGCAMAKDDDDYVLKGLDQKDGEVGSLDQPSAAAQAVQTSRHEAAAEADRPMAVSPGQATSAPEPIPDADEMWERGLEGLVEPLRASSW